MTDTLYYPVRNWLSANPLMDVSIQQFVAYLAERTLSEDDMKSILPLIKSNKWFEPENWVEIENRINISLIDIHFLFKKDATACAPSFRFK